MHTFDIFNALKLGSRKGVFDTPLLFFRILKSNFFRLIYLMPSVLILLVRQKKGHWAVKTETRCAGDGNMLGVKKRDT